MKASIRYRFIKELEEKNNLKVEPYSNDVITDSLNKP